MLLQLLTKYKPASKWLTLMNYVTVYGKVCSCFTEEHVHMAVAEGKLLTSGKQNKLQNVLGIKMKRGQHSEVCLMHNLQIINVFIFPFATYWLVSPRDLLRNQGKKNTRFHLIPWRIESYNVKNTCWKKSTAVQKFWRKVFFYV